MLRVEVLVARPCELGMRRLEEDDEILPEEASLAHVAQRVAGRAQLLRGEAGHAQRPRSESHRPKLLCVIACGLELGRSVVALGELV